MDTTEEILNELSKAIHSVPLGAQPQRKLSKKGFFFSDLPLGEQILLWDQIWKNSTSFWPKVHAFFYCEKLLNKPQQLISIWPIICQWQDYVTDWGTCDCLSKIYSKVLEVNPDLVLPVLRDWNYSGDPWKRRQSIVSLIFYHSARENFLSFEVIGEMVHNLIEDKDYYVQRGVGWTLRELFRTYPDQTLTYFYRNVKSISSTAFQTISKSLPMKEKEKLLLLRRKN